MILLIICLLFLIPLCAYLLELLGIKSVFRSEVLLSHLAISDVRPLLIFYSRNAGWSLISEEKSGEKELYVFRMRKWGSSKLGAQKLTATFFPDAEGVKGFIQSESLFGQFIDFGINQKNVEELAFFLTDAAKQEYISKREELTREGFLKPSPPIDFRYFIILAAVLGLYLLVSLIIEKSNVIEYGYIVVTVDQKVTPDTARQIFDDIGAINCTAGHKDNPYAYLCEVPVTQEQQISRDAKRSPFVRDAHPLYK